MMTLVAVAITVAYTYSSWVVFSLPRAMFFWELATLTDIMLFGHWVEMRSIMGASRALEKLVKLLPATAHLLHPDGGVAEVSTTELKRGDLVLAPYLKTHRFARFTASMKLLMGVTGGTFVVVLCGWLWGGVEGGRGGSRLSGGGGDRGSGRDWKLLWVQLVGRLILGGVLCLW